MMITKQGLLTRIDRIIEELAVVKWAKERAIDYIGIRKEENPQAQYRVNWWVAENRTPFGIQVQDVTAEEAIGRLKELPIFEKYFLFVYTLYENYRSENNDPDKDKKCVELLRFRIIRNLLIHNNQIVSQNAIDEFAKLAKEYDTSLKQSDIDRLFRYECSGAELLSDEFWPESLQKFRDLLKDRLP